MIGIQLFGEVAGHEDAPACHQDGAFDHVFEFADISGIGIGLQDQDGFFGEADGGKFIFFAVVMEEMFGQGDDIGAALAKRRHADANDVQPVE